MGTPEKEGKLDESVFTEGVETGILGSRAAAMRAFLAGRVIGQPQAVEAIVRRFTVHHAGLDHPTRPIGAFIFAGPTGVGKSMLAEELARFLIADVPDPPFTEIQGERYTDDHQVMDLIGAPPSYVGWDQPPLLAQLKIDGPHFWAKITPALESGYHGPLDEKSLSALMLKYYRQFHPYYSVILVDELEKADPKLSEMLLGMIDKGRLQMSDGAVTHFRNSVIIVTCNVAGDIQQAALAGNRGAVGFGGTREDDRLSVDEFITKRTIEEIKKFWPSAFVGRLRRNIVVFRALDHDSCRKILDARLDELRGRLNAPGGTPIVLQASDGFKDYVLDRADYRGFGARQINDMVEELVTEPLADAIESEQLIDGDEALFTLNTEGRPVLKRRPRAPAPQTQAIVPVEEPDEGTAIPITVGGIKKR